MSPRKVELFLRSLLFSVGGVVSVTAWSLLSLLTWPFSLRIRYGVVRQWARFMVWWLGVTCRVRTVLSGVENIPAQPCVILVKHQSTWETLFMQHLFVPQVWVLKRELLWVPVFGWALALLKPIAIDRKDGRGAMRQVLAQGKQRLEEGDWVVIFPEGTRVAPGTRGQYHAGGAILAAHAKSNILPIAHNAGEVWPRRGFIKYPGTIHFVIGPPIDGNHRSGKELIALTEAWIEHAQTTLPPARDDLGMPPAP